MYVAGLCFTMTCLYTKQQLMFVCTLCIWSLILCCKKCMKTTLTIASAGMNEQYPHLKVLGKIYSEVYSYCINFECGSLL